LHGFRFIFGPPKGLETLHPWQSATRPQDLFWLPRKSGSPKKDRLRLLAAAPVRPAVSGRIEAPWWRASNQKETEIKMPNWTSNKISIRGSSSDISEFLAFMRGTDDQLFDFNRIIPMPVLLRHTASGFHKFGDEEHCTWYVINPDLAFGDPEYKNNQRPFTPEEKAALAAIGADSWYDWAVKNWGTKWNACRAEINEILEDDGTVEISFDTAWSAPFPIFQAIAAKFDQLTFQFSWTDEHEPGVTHSMTVRCGEEGAQ
jgi:Ferredoxin-like domain in Api92-like protein